MAIASRLGAADVNTRRADGDAGVLQVFPGEQDHGIGEADPPVWRFDFGDFGLLCDGGECEDEDEDGRDVACYVSTSWS